jgi:hypothetical protein
MHFQRGAARRGKPAKALARDVARGGAAAARHGEGSQRGWRRATWRGEQRRTARGGAATRDAGATWERWRGQARMGVEQDREGGGE